LDSYETVIYSITTETIYGVPRFENVVTQEYGNFIPTKLSLPYYQTKLSPTT